jgi:hypothetical protein
LRLFDGFFLLSRLFGVLGTLGRGGTSLLVVTTLEGDISDKLSLKGLLKDLIKAGIGVRG